MRGFLSKCLPCGIISREQKSTFAGQLCNPIAEDLDFTAFVYNDFPFYWLSSKMCSVNRPWRWCTFLQEAPCVYFSPGCSAFLYQTTWSRPVFFFFFFSLLWIHYLLKWAVWDASLHLTSPCPGFHTCWWNRHVSRWGSAVNQAVHRTDKNWGKTQLNLHANATVTFDFWLTRMNTFILEFAVVL